MSKQRPARERQAVEPRALETLAEWFETESSARKSAIGVANGALHLLEILRDAFPLRPQDYTSKRGSQVKGMSGPSGDRIVRRFIPGAHSIGSEAGRTSRGVLPAVQRLANRLNSLSSLQLLTPRQRNTLASALQRWVVENPIKAHFERQRLEPFLDPKQTSISNIAAILDAAFQRNQSGPVAQHLVGAKLALRYPDREIENRSYSTADTQLKRPADFVVGDSAIHVTMTPSVALLEKCRRNIRRGYRTLILVPDNRAAGARQMAENLRLANRVEVVSIEAFVGQNIQELAGFSQQKFEDDLRHLLEIYNERVRESETDLSLLIDIPDNLGVSRN